MNRLYPLSAALSVLLLIGCSPKSTEPPTSGSGAAISSQSSLQSTSATLSSISSETSSSEEALTPEEALSALYEDAVEVESLVESVWDNLGSEAQSVLSEMLTVFSQDVELLGYYAEVSKHEPLTDEELDLVLNIMVDVEDAMEILAQAIEQLL